ncbi:MAG: HNH endonuclease [Actinomycetota bacterium]|nr:HNH endonuclease [Actinomycetota bacterium]MDP3630831.1 HNH endonuclease [Actinomycetota bacterium]
MPRNPAWTRDELILALDLFFRVDPIRVSSDSLEIREVSAILNELPIHMERPDSARFRNPNGVHMKLSNFLRFDPAYAGKGLTRGGHLEEDVWNEFSADRPALAATAQAIRDNRGSISVQQVAAQTTGDEEEFSEGLLLEAIHKRRERSPSAVHRKKESVLTQNGSLECEACGFDFEAVYGDLGRGYAECHHTKPLSELSRSTKTRLGDLAIVCANCHRMIHRSRPMLTISELGEVVTTEIIDF